jgi:hypothetical protein
MMHAGTLSPSLMWPTPIHNICRPSFVRMNLAAGTLHGSFTQSGTKIFFADTPVHVAILTASSCLGVVLVPEFTVVPCPQLPQHLQVSTRASSPSSIHIGHIVRDFDTNPVMAMTIDDSSLLAFNGSSYSHLHIPAHHSVPRLYNYARFTWEFLENAHPPILKISDEQVSLNPPGPLTISQG